MPKDKPSVSTSNPFVSSKEEVDIKAAVAAKVSSLRAETDKLVQKMIMLTGEVGWMGALRRLANEIESHIARVALKDADIAFSIAIVDGTRMLASVRMGDRVAELVSSNGVFLPFLLRVDRFKEWSVYKVADDLEEIKSLLSQDIADFNALKEFVEVWEPRFLKYLEFNADPIRKRAREIEGLVIGC
jgi:hypothetical protein